MKNERLLWTLLVLGVIVVGIIAYCNKPYEFKVSRTPYKEKISPLKAYLDTAKLLTYVYEDSFFVVQYPDKFKINTKKEDDFSVTFEYITERVYISLSCYTALNDEHWDSYTGADSIAAMREADSNDTVTMKDVHDGYFYLRTKSSDGFFRTYEQYVMSRDIVYILELTYSPNIEKDIQRLFQLVHDWDVR